MGKRLLKSFFGSRDNQVVIALVVLSLVLITVGLYLLSGQDIEEGPIKVPNSIEEVVWQEESDNDFGFKINYPEHFQLVKDDKTYGPIFNFIKKENYSSEPLTHLDNASHVSIYPTGLPLGGLNFSFSEKDFVNKNGIEFLLQEFRTREGDLWGILATPKIDIEGWKPWGFVWIASEIRNEEYLCLSGEAEIDPDLCNPFEGDEIFKSGEVDNKFIQIGREMLDSFE
jgi:hypothetical protein